MGHLPIVIFSWSNLHFLLQLKRYSFFSQNCQNHRQSNPLERSIKRAPQLTSLLTNFSQYYKHWQWVMLWAKSLTESTLVFWYFFHENYQFVHTSYAQVVLLKGKNTDRLKIWLIISPITFANTCNRFPSPHLPV